MQRLDKVHIGNRWGRSHLLHLVEVLDRDARAFTRCEKARFGHRELALSLEGKGLAVFEPLEVPRVDDEVRFDR